MNAIIQPRTVVLFFLWLGLSNAQAQSPSSPEAEKAGECENVDAGSTPGLYVSTDEGLVYIIQGEDVIELAPNEAAFANKDGMTCVREVPEFLDWPCSTPEAKDRRIPSYTLDSLSQDNTAREVVRRYFEIPQIIEPMPRWKNGEYHGTFDAKDIIQFPTIEYWYRSAGPTSILHDKRPRTLLITLYVGLSEVVVDVHALDILLDMYGGKNVPVVFNYANLNEVPVSYFGDNVSLEELADAFFKSGIRISNVPMWNIGDHHLKPTIQEFDKLFTIPALDDIDPDLLQALVADLRINGFTKKPVSVSMMGESALLMVDQPERIRAAQSVGIVRIPTIVLYFGENAHLARCGPSVNIEVSGPGRIFPPAGLGSLIKGVPAQETPASGS